MSIPRIDHPAPSTRKWAVELHEDRIVLRAKRNDVTLTDDDASWVWSVLHNHTPVEGATLTQLAHSLQEASLATREVRHAWRATELVRTNLSAVTDNLEALALAVASGDTPLAEKLAANALP